MAIFDQKTAPRKDAAPFNPDLPPFREAGQPASADANPATGPAPSAPRPQVVAKESLIAADLTIEGKIEGNGNVRIAGKFKGDVNVQGDLTIEQGAKLTGGVRARRVVISGELEGNIEGAQQVELQQGGVLAGDVKCGTMTVASGARMRGQADFGWEDKGTGAKPGNASAA
jgi:cytoskeletal protein CcmA (bactofilin family)